MLKRCSTDNFFQDIEETEDDESLAEKIKRKKEIVAEPIYSFVDFPSDEVEDYPQKYIKDHYLYSKDFPQMMSDCVVSRGHLKDRLFLFIVLAPNTSHS